MYRHPAEKLTKSTSVHAKVVAPEDTTLFVEDCKALGANLGGLLTDRYPDPSRVLLLFPSKNAKPLSQLPRSSFDTLIVLDGTWQQAKGMYKSLEHVGFQSVTIGFPDDSATTHAPPVLPTGTEESVASPTKKIRSDRDLGDADEAKLGSAAVDAPPTASLPPPSSATPPPPVKTLFWRYQSLGDHCLATIEAVYYFYRDYFSVYSPAEVYDGRFEGLLFYFRIQYETVQNAYRGGEREFTKRKAGAESYIKK
ncbi:DTW domain-containing protein 1 [Podochytrium sp. JEL0797]|nr:DTW domain-containing protein 1 [Podochytrium sp. JEL0797]